MASNYNENHPQDQSEFTKKMKQFFSNRAVVVTLVTVLLTLSVLIGVTVAASRTRRPVTDGEGTSTSAVTNKKDQDAFANGQETLPVFHGDATLPVGNLETDAPQALSFSLPAQGVMSKGHDATIQVYSPTMGDYRVHLGMDITTAAEAPVYAAAAGKVERVWEDAMLGVCVAIDHGDKTLTIYKNLDATLADGIAAGKQVKNGQQIGRVGDTAISEMAEEPHLHFEVTVDGLQVDPLTYFSKENTAILTAENGDNAYESSAVTKGK